MPNRIIKESICTSEEVDRLSAFQETFFYRLIVNCDDFGRMDARAKILKSKLFPLKDIRTDQIDAALEALSSAKLVILYEVDGKPFLQMRTWDRHQQVRAKKSRFPAPDITCNQMISDTGKCPRNPIQSESNPNPNPKRENTHAREEDAKKDPDGFEAFWESYPRKTGDTRTAYIEYLRVLDSGVNPGILISAALELSRRTAAEDFRFLPAAEKWLRNKGWLEKQPAGAKQSRNHITSAAKYKAPEPKLAPEELKDLVAQI